MSDRRPGYDVLNKRRTRRGMNRRGERLIGGWRCPATLEDFASDETHQRKLFWTEERILRSPAIQPTVSARLPRAGSFEVMSSGQPQAHVDIDQ
jgi:hypothetical protein